MKVRKIMKYEGLSIDAKCNCIYGLLEKIAPYGDFDDMDIGWDSPDMIYEINETLETGLFSIDHDGNWYDEEGTKI